MILASTDGIGDDYTTEKQTGVFYQKVGDFIVRLSKDTYKHKICGFAWGFFPLSKKHTV